MKLVFLQNLITISLLLVAIPVSAQVPTYGFGSAKCEIFLRDIKLRGDVGEGMYFSWAQGFVTAANMMSYVMRKDAVKNFTAKFDRVQQQTFLREECQKNPSQEFVTVVWKLLDKLREADGLVPLR
jgi:hypothetical protein